MKGEGAFAASGTCVATWGDSTAWIATGAGEQARVLRTANRGASWTAVVTPIVQGKPSSGHASIAWRSALEGLAAGGDLADSTATPKRVILTSDGGATWQVGGGVTFNGGVYGAAFSGTTANVVAVGPKGASWSRDGGKTWAALDANSHWSVAFANDSTGWMVGPSGRITKIILP